MAFDIMSLRRNSGAQGQPDQQKSKAEEHGDRAELKYIDVYDLVPSDENFYSMSAIGELAAAIELAGGVKQPGLVVPMGGGKYKVLAGHRRRLASIRLVEQGKEKYRFMPCVVDTVQDEAPEAGAEESPEELRGINEEILLIVTNCQREKTDWDKVEEATRLRTLLAAKRKFQKVPGHTREIIAEQLRTTPAQVGRYESIAKKLLPELKEAMKNEQVNISVAYELSISPEQVQKRAYQDLQETGALSIEDVKRRRQEAEARQPMPGQTYFEGNEVREPEEAAQIPAPQKQAQKPEPIAETEQEAAQAFTAPPVAPDPSSLPAPDTNHVAGAEPPQEENIKPPRPEETRCVDDGICPHCLEKFNAEEAVNYSTQGTQCSSPVPCPHCGKLINIFCSVEYFCSVPEE